MDTRLTTLFDITADTLTNELLNQLIGAGSVYNFALSSRYIYSLYSKTAIFRLAKDYLKQAFDHVCFGEFDSLEILLNASPDILMCRGTIYHPGRFKFVNRFIWQIAAMNEEADNERVRTMFEKYFKRLPNGLEEMKNQYLEVFPGGKMIKYGWDLEVAKKLFNNIHDAIIIDKTLDENNLDKMNDATRQALLAFCAYVTPKPSDEFTKGLIFDIQIYQYLLEKFAPIAYQLNWNQFVFYGIKLWNHLDELLPTGYLRPQCQGIYQVVERKEPLSVNGCRLRTDAGIGTGAAILPLNVDSCFSFDRDFIGYLGVRSGGRGRRAHAGAWLSWVSSFGNLCRAKTASRGNIMQQLQHQPNQLLLNRKP